jgi:hypothetical protein
VQGTAIVWRTIPAVIVKLAPSLAVAVARLGLDEGLPGLQNAQGRPSERPPAAHRRGTLNRGRRTQPSQSFVPDPKSPGRRQRTSFHCTTKPKFAIRAALE